MKKALPVLKVVLPLLLGVYIIWYFYQALGPKDKEQMFYAFKTADYTWVIISLFLGWFSHMSRAYRWRYLLEPIGAKVPFWTAYHTVMIGYIINLALPRAGEPARAAYLSKRAGVPFAKIFGTIVVSRVIDIGMLGIVALVTISMQYDKLDEFMVIAESFGGAKDEGTPWITYTIYGVIGLGLVALAFLYFTKEKFRDKIRDLVRGFIEGMKTIFTMPKKWAFIGHTLFIWIMYLSMFGVCYWSMPETGGVPVQGILAGFVAGTIGIIVIQGGIGVYPILVGIAVTLYLGVPEGGDSANALHPIGSALGWIIWTSQTLLVVLLGALSLLLIPKVPDKHEPITRPVR